MPPGMRQAIGARRRRRRPRFVRRVGDHMVTESGFRPAEPPGIAHERDHHRSRPSAGGVLRREALAVRCDRRPDQAVRVPLYRPQSRGELSRPARFARQLRRQQPADAAVPAREDRRADRPRLRQGDRPADGCHRARRGRPAARDHGHLLRLCGSCADLRHRRHRPDGREPAPTLHRLDPHRQRPGRASPQLRQMGLPARQHRGRAGLLRPRLWGDDDRAAGPDLHVLRRLAAGAAADRADRSAVVRRRQGTGADGGGPGGAGGRRRPPAGGTVSGAARRICRPHAPRLRQSRGARRNRRRRRLRRQWQAQLSQSPQAQPEHGEERLPRSRPTASTAPSAAPSRFIPPAAR